jgi:TusA-related sulfurtransferase
MTWVRTRVALGRIPLGGVLEVLLRDGEPRESVPRTAAAEGHRVLRVEPAPEEGPGSWRVWLERGAPVEETPWP